MDRVGQPGLSTPGFLITSIESRLVISVNAHFQTVVGQIAGSCRIVANEDITPVLG